jgi:UDP-N-acetylmuramoyl-L-alanyl-D-glutamate--2,6-diaminopimelate ligase
VAAGNESVVMEATSHGLALERTRNCRFDVGVVTSVTSEHLEFHGSLEAYRSAKARLVQEAPTAILNTDDDAYAFFRERARDRVLTYGIDADADLRATELVADAFGSRFTLVAPDWSGEVSTPMPGRFNVSNALAALAIAHVEGVAWPVAVEALARTAGVPGRMERIDAGQPFAVVVDYAHTADSLGKVLRMLRPVTHGRLIAVFGSAGERDPTKRPAMGRVGAELADLTVVTDEDPRLEDPRAINEAIADGARAAGAVDGESLMVIDDRREAISHAIGLAREGDVVLLAGKGHETSIFYGGAKLPWDDREVARDALAAAGWGTR